MYLTRDYQHGFNNGFLLREKYGKIFEKNMAKLSKNRQFIPVMIIPSKVDKVDFQG
jgi:hypothetical protein